VYLHAKCDHHVGFANITLRELLHFLFQAYRQLTPQTLMGTPCEHEQAMGPKPALRNRHQIEDAMELAEATKQQPFTMAQILTSVYTLVFATGLYFDECKDWQKKPTNNKMWHNFKTHFLEVQCNLCLQQQHTTGRAGMQANKATKVSTEEAATALANLAEATAADRETFAALVATNADLNQQLTAVLTEIQDLKNLVLRNTISQTPTT